MLKGEAEDFVSFGYWIFEASYPLCVLHIVIYQTHSFLNQFPILSFTLRV